MNLFKRVTLLAMVLVFLTGNIASVAASCCMTVESVNVETQMDHQGDTNIPCHNTAKNDKQDHACCDGCDCQHGLKMTALPPQTSIQVKVSAGVKTFDVQSIHSCLPEGVFQPPKHIS